MTNNEPFQASVFSVKTSDLLSQLSVYKLSKISEPIIGLNHLKMFN